MNPTILPPAIGKIAGQVVLFNLRMETDVGERKKFNSSMLNYV